LIDFGANLNLVKVEALGVESTGRVKVNPEALQVFKEARGKWLWLTEVVLVLSSSGVTILFWVWLLKCLQPSAKGSCKQLIPK